MSPAEAGRGHRIHLEAVVTYSDAEWGLLFIADKTGQTFVDVHGMRISVSPGMRIDIDGVSKAGDLFPAISQPAIRVQGRGPLPPPHRATLAELETTLYDSQLVETTGVLRPAHRPSWYRLGFRIVDGRNSALVVVPRRDDGWGTGLIDARVRVRGVSGVEFLAGKRTNSLIFVERPENIVVEEPAPPDPFGIAVSSIQSALAADAEQRFVHRVKVRGTVTYRNPQLFYVQDGDHAIPVYQDDTSNIHVGDTIDVIGFPGSTNYGKGLVEASSRLVKSGSPSVLPNALFRHASQLSMEMNGRLVRVRGRLVSERRSGGERILLLDDNGVTFTAVMPSLIPDAQLQVPLSSSVEITGVPFLGHNKARLPPSLVILASEARMLRDGNPLVLKYVFMAAGGLAIVLGISLLWIGMLRRVVRQQVKVIRERIENEAQLESKYRRLFERNLAGVFRWRADGTIIDCNPAFAGMLRCGSPEQMIRHSYWEFDIRQDDRKRLEAALAEGPVNEWDAQLRRTDGTTIFLVENITPVSDPEGMVYETTAIDITRTRRREEELRSARDAAESASRCKSEFLANMSHEIRTPINGVIGMLELVLPRCKSCGDADQVESLAAIRSSADLLLVVIDSILDFSRIEAGKIELDSAPFDLRGNVEALTRLQQTHARDQLDILCRFGPGVPQRVLGDRVRFLQVMNNLVGNAIKFTERGEVLIEVSVASWQADRAAISIAVRDTGIGIEPEKQAAIFDAFTQADSSTTRRFGGTGLGLAISSRIVQLMGGELRVDSTPGVGSTFSFTVWFPLPAEAATPDSDLTQVSAVNQKEAGSRQSPTPGAKPRDGTFGRQVLVAEDNAVNRKVVTGLLERLGCRVSVAENGREAVEKWTQYPYETVFMDVQMPEMDGYEATRLIRQAESEAPERRARTRIVALTAHALPDARERCLAAGMDTHLAKPVTLDSLARELAGENRVSSGPVTPAEEPSRTG